jgi:hypothetical protein
MIQSRRHQGGFAFILSVALTILVATALAAMASLLATEIKRTNQQPVDAQLRQLLLTASLVTQNHLNKTQLPPDQIDIELPADLTDAKLKVLTKIKTDTIIAQIHASLGDHTASQALTFARSDGRWSVVSTEFGK